MARVHSGDPTLYGTLHEQLGACRALGLDTVIVPLVAVRRGCEPRRIPDVSQSLIITRRAQRTSTPPTSSSRPWPRTARWRCLRPAPARAPAGPDRRRLRADTPAAVVYKASWPDEIVFAAAWTRSARASARRRSRRRRSCSSVPRSAAAPAPASRTSTTRTTATATGASARRASTRNVPEIHVLGVSGGAVPPGTEHLLEARECRRGRPRRAEQLAPGREHVVAGRGPRRDAAGAARRRRRAASGDPRFFGIVRALSALTDELVVHPALSSIALAFARLGVPGTTRSWSRPRPRPARGDQRRAAPPEGRDPPPTRQHRADRRRPRGRATPLVAEALGTPDERLATEPPFNDPNVVIVHEPTAGRVAVSAAAHPSPLGAARRRVRAPRRDDHRRRRSARSRSPRSVPGPAITSGTSAAAAARSDRVRTPRRRRHRDRPGPRRVALADPQRGRARRPARHRPRRRARLAARSPPRARRRLRRRRRPLSWTRRRGRAARWSSRSP